MTEEVQDPQEREEVPWGIGNSIKKHLEKARRNKENPEATESNLTKSSDIFEHDPEVDTVRGLNEGERDELMALFKRKERSTLGVLKQRTTEAKLKAPKTKSINFELLGISCFGMAGNFGFSEDFFNYIKNNFQCAYDKTTKMWIF